MSQFGKSLDTLFQASFVPEDIAAASFDFEWKGPEAHLAPARTTPLSKALAGKTSCALFVLTSAALVWAARRLHRIADVVPILNMAEALLCYQDDANYVRRDRPQHLQSKVPKQREVAETFCYEATAIFQATPGEHSCRPPIQATENAIALTRHVLGPEWTNPFRDWVKTTISLLDRIAPNPVTDFQAVYDFESEAEFAEYVARNVGPPLPISVCDPRNQASAADLQKEYNAFLTNVDWQGNPYLASPDLMRKLGSKVAYGGV